MDIKLKIFLGTFTGVALASIPVNLRKAFRHKKRSAELQKENEALDVLLEKFRKLDAGEDFTYTRDELIEEAKFWTIIPID